MKIIKNQVNGDLIEVVACLCMLLPTQIRLKLAGV